MKCCGNYLREETIHGYTVFFFCFITFDLWSLADKKCAEISLWIDFRYFTLNSATMQFSLKTWQLFLTMTSFFWKVEGQP